MRRREFITLVGGTAAARSLAVRAQQTRLPIIGFLGANATAWSAWTTAFVQLDRGPHSLSSIAGMKDNPQPERIAEIAAEFIRLKVDVIVTNAIAAPILKQATTVIPIVFAIAPDPVHGGLVASLARPGGNVTGQSIQSIDLVGKRLAFLREIFPHLRLLAIVFNADFSETVAEADVVKATARTLGLEVVPLEIRRTDDVAPAFETLKSQIDALYVVADALVSANRSRIITFALGKRLPTIFNTRDYVEVGALMSYGPKLPNFIPPRR